MYNARLYRVFYRFSSTRLINSIMKGHECKILFIMWYNIAFHRTNATILPWENETFYERQRLTHIWLMGFSSLLIGRVDFQI